ncbi:hypothetical protein GOP47_0022775 [Adiantum capillus-veneris]|uniref:Uncharacterized protein n=1 Tax=Adiantum capillus-veneris TaxID=13818 RepID=A0A9D4U8C8_ADICA|nr:hypothetical protein GOP47_0022775 [Adiantum capillus-veneris]
MAADLSSTALSTHSPPPVTLNGGAVRHNIRIPVVSSAPKWHFEPRPCKLRLQQTPPLIAPNGQEADELASSLIFFPDPSNDTLLLHPSQLSSSLFFFSHRSQQEQESSERDDFYANMGSAIRIIREETPFLFYKDLNYSIYRTCKGIGSIH